LELETERTVLFSKSVVVASAYWFLLDDKKVESRAVFVAVSASDAIGEGKNW
jgi:hypothetical protein